MLRILVTMLNCANLPIPLRAGQPSPIVSLTSEEPPTQTILTQIYPVIKTTVNQILNMKNLTALHSLLGVPTLEFTPEGTYLNEEQLTALNEEIEASRQAALDRDQAIGDRQSAITALNALDPKVAAEETIEGKVSAIRMLLAAKPAVAPTGVQTASDKTPSPDGVDWELLNSLPHMQEDRY